MKTTEQLTRLSASVRREPQKPKKPCACIDCGSPIPVRSPNWEQGICYRCFRRDSRTGPQKVRYQARYRGLHAFRDGHGKTSHHG